MNYFELFDLPIKFAIDENRLNSVYLKKQKAALVSPDNSETSETLNLAYDVLSDPIKRAEYLLKLHGHETEISQSPENALAMFSIREKFDSLHNDAEREKFFNFLDARIAEFISALPALENDLDAFHKKFEFIAFMHSFLEKVRSNVYCGN